MPFSHACCRFWFLTVLLTGLNLSYTHAQKNNKNDERKENERVRDAERELSEARKQLAPIQNELKAAFRKLDTTQDKLVAAKRSLREAEAQAESELGQSIGIPEAIAKVSEKRQVYDVARKPVLDQLHSRSEWKALQEQVEKAKAERDELRENVEFEDAKRDELLKALNQTIDRPFAVEEKALQGNAACVDAKRELDKASEELSTLRKKLTPSKVESHALVTKATKAIQEIEQTVRSQEKEVGKIRSEAVKAQRKVAQAQSELIRAKQADANDPNKNKKSNKSKN